jgi:hypothetical protein
MAFSFHPDERTGIFHVRAFGKINDAEVMDLCDRLSQEPPFVASWPIICDCSAVKALLVSSNLIESLAKAARTRHNLLAIIAPKAVVFGLARMYQVHSDPNDKRIHVFAKAQDARVWLSEEMKERPCARDAAVVETHAQLEL